MSLAETSEGLLLIGDVLTTRTTRFETRDIETIETLIQEQLKTGTLRIHYSQGTRCLIDFVETEKSLS